MGDYKHDRVADVHWIERGTIEAASGDDPVVSLAMHRSGLLHAVLESGDEPIVTIAQADLSDLVRAMLAMLRTRHDDADSLAMIRGFQIEVGSR